jgi:hypothetical protein
MRILDFSDGLTSASEPTAVPIPASNVANTPAGSLAASTVQAALNELQGDIDTINANDWATNARLANMAQSTIKGRAAGAGTGDPTDLTATQATAILDTFVGDSGSGGTKGLVPAPVSGDSIKFLRGNGTWSSPGSTISVVTKDTSYTILDNDGYQVIETTTGASTVTHTLPTAADNSGRRIAFKKLDSVGKLIIDGEGAETIDGLSSVQIAFENDTIELYCNGTGWKFVGLHYQSFNETAPTITNAGTSPSGFVKGVRIGRQVTITAQLATGASGSPSSAPGMTTPLPSDFRPTTSVQVTNEIVSSTDSLYQMDVSASGSLTFTRFIAAGATDIGTSSWATNVTERFHATFVKY